MSAALPGMDAGSPTMAGRIRLILAILLVVLIAESIGTFSFVVGKGKVVLQPMLWAIFIGAIVAMLARRAPSPIGISEQQQSYISGYLQFALMPFLAKLGLMVGGSLPSVKAAGFALVFQEFGHFFGTMAIGLPLALLLGIKREAIGATFSVGREPSLAIIAERFGMKSPEGRGVMAEYITGTVLGALFIGVLASLITSLGIFDPRSLAMGAGVGSGSMSGAEYVEGLRLSFVPYTVVFALIKALVFAFLVSAISAYKGYTMKGGSLEVGAASTAAVTNSIIAILVGDYVLAQTLL